MLEVREEGRLSPECVRARIHTKALHFTYRYIQHTHTHTHTHTCIQHKRTCILCFTYQDGIKKERKKKKGQQKQNTIPPPHRWHICNWNLGVSERWYVCVCVCVCARARAHFKTRTQRMHIYTHRHTHTHDTDTYSCAHTYWHIRTHVRTCVYSKRTHSIVREHIL